jgi:hypothetical protein
MHRTMNIKYKNLFLVSRVIFWVVLRRMMFNSRRFGTLCLFNLHIHSPMKMEKTHCSDTSVIKHHTPENNSKYYYDNLSINAYVM